VRTRRAVNWGVLALVALAAYGFAPVLAAKHSTSPGPVPAPLDNETCFSPDEPCSAKLKTFIASAQTSLDIAIYDINEEEIVHAILVQSKKIPVRVIVDRRQSKGSHSSVALLQKAGVQVRYGYQRGIMHNKFTIVDGSRVEVGSYNYTSHATVANQENQVYLGVPSIVERYKVRFEQMWAAAKEE
jgi:phosphatidylserine/phosphatidylglycerophosphate/cardiolipin synthase-like enzyme